MTPEEIMKTRDDALASIPVPDFEKFPLFQLDVMPTDSGGLFGYERGENFRSLFFFGFCFSFRAPYDPKQAWLLGFKDASEAGGAMTGRLIRTIQQQAHIIEQQKKHGNN